MNFIIIGTVIGVIAVIENLFIFAVVKRKNILKLKFLSDVLWLFNYLFLGGITGAVLNVIAMLRETVFYLRDKKKFASHIFWLPVFMVLTLISPVLDCIKQGAFVPMTLLPASGSLLTVYSLYQKNAEATRYIALVAQSLWLAYAIMLMNYTAVFSNVLQLISALIGIARVFMIRRNLKAEKSVPSEAEDN